MVRIKDEFLGEIMSTFPGIKFTTITPSAAIPGVPAQLDVRTGEAQVFGALADLGDQLTSVGRKYKVLERETELSEKTAELQITLATALQNMATAPDKDAANAIYKEAVGIAGEFKSDDSIVTHEFDIIRNAALAGFQIKGQGISNKIQIENLEIREKNIRQESLNNGDQSAYEASVARSVTAGMPTEAGKQLVREYGINSAFAQATIGADTDPVSALKKVQAIEVKTAEQAKQKDNLIAHINTIINRTNGELKQLQEEQEWELYKKSEDGTLTLDMINDSVLSADEKKILWRNHKQVQAEKRATGISQLEEGDPIVLAQVQAIIDLKPESITEEQIYGLIDKGLGTKHTTGLVTRLRNNLKEDNRVPTKFRSELANLHTNKLFGKRDDPDTSDIFLRLSRNLDAFLSTKPSEEETRRFFSQLIRADVSWGFSHGPNELPGFKETPLTIELDTEQGRLPTSINFGDIVEIDGELQQAVGRKGGKVQWRKVKRQ